MALRFSSLFLIFLPRPYDSTAEEIRYKEEKKGSAKEKENCGLDGNMGTER